MSRPQPPDPTLPPWPQYAEAVVELIVDGEHLVLTPCVLDAAAQGALSSRGAPLWVLTAGDPCPVELDAVENAARNALLRDDIERLGLRHHPALGRSPDGSTFEVSVAVRGTSREVVLDLAARHGQLAVYELDDRIGCIDVASRAVVTTVPYRMAAAPAGSDVLVGPTGWRG